RYTALRQSAPYLPSSIAIVGNGSLLRTAGGEIAHALPRGPKTQRATSSLPAKNALVLGGWSAIHPLFPELRLARALRNDGFWLKPVQFKRAKYWLIVGGND